MQKNRTRRGGVARSDFAEVEHRRLDAIRRPDHAADADRIFRRVLGVGNNAHLVVKRTDLRICAADGDVHFVLILSSLADVRHAVGFVELLERDFHPIAGHLHVLDLERFILFGVERHALRGHIALQLIEANESGGICLNVRLDHCMNGQRGAGRRRVVGFQGDRLGDRPGEGRRVDVSGDFARFAGFDHFVEIGDGAAAARFRGNDLQISGAGVLDEK